MAAHILGEDIHQRKRRHADENINDAAQRPVSLTHAPRREKTILSPTKHDTYGFGAKLAMT